MTGRDSGENENAIKTFVSTDSDPFQAREFTINNAEMAARNMANNEKDRKYQWQTCSQPLYRECEKNVPKQIYGMRE